MLERFLTEDIFAVTLFWAVLYALDYYLTILGARLVRQAGVGGSYELTPAFQKDIEALRLFSPQFMLRWAFSCLMLPVVWYLSVKTLGLPEIFLVVWGALVLREFAIYFRHVQNLYFYRQTHLSEGMRTSAQMPRWLTYQLSAVQLFTFAGLFLLLSLAANPWFFLGGVVSCLETGIQHWLLARKSRPPSEVGAKVT